MDRPKGMSRHCLKVTHGQMKRGIGMMYALVLPEHNKEVERHDWKLVYRWGGPDKPKFAAECKVDGKRTTLHRFIAGLVGQKIDGMYVLPKDEDALHCWPDNLEIATKEELSELRARKAGQRNNLTTAQQSWLDAECKRVGKSRWQVMGMLIDEKLSTPAPNEWD